MELGHMTMSTGLRCWAVRCGCRQPAHCCHLWGCRVVGRPVARGSRRISICPGHNAGVVLSHAPTTPEYTVPPHLFRVLLLERLGLPLPVTEARCTGCHEPLDPTGRHFAACPRIGRLRKRATPIKDAGSNLSRGRRTRQV